MAYGHVMAYFTGHTVAVYTHTQPTLLKSLRKQARVVWALRSKAMGHNMGIAHV